MQPNARKALKAFTLIELMVVAAIISILLTLTVPAIRGLVESSSLAQTDNMVRATLISARTYAMKNSVVAGVRFQQDGHMVTIYARNNHDVFNPDDFINPPIFDMKAVAGYEPGRCADPWRVTTAGMGYHAGTIGVNVGHYVSTMVTGQYSEYPPASEWMDEEHAWFVFPVVLFSPRGKVILADCKFHYSTDPSSGWYPTMDGAFGKATDRDPNNNPIPSHSQTRYIDQGGKIGWRSNSYKGSASHWIPVEAPTVTSVLRVFNYEEFKGCNPPSTDAIESMLATRSDCVVDPHTGQVVRMRAYTDVINNN